MYRKGTVIAAVITNDEVILATDSRVNPTQGKGHDNAEKLVELNSEIVVTMAGHASRSGGWDAFKDLEQFRQIRDPQLLRHLWGELQAQHFRDDLASPHSAHFLQSLPAPILEGDGFLNYLLTGMFVSTQIRKIFAMQIALFRNDKEWNIHLRPAEIGAECSFICGFGKREIIDEARAGITDRGKLWNRALSGLEPRARAIEAVRLTIQHHPHTETVGGSIDSLVVGGGGITWLTRKSQT